jgi:hypothetical protein
MNAAEITDKLGLHSLRQRAWVRLNRSTLVSFVDIIHSIFNLLAQLRAMGCTKVSSG